MKMQPWKKIALAKIAAVAGLLATTETDAVAGTLDVTYAQGYYADAFNPGEFTVHLDENDINLLVLGAYNPAVLVDEASRFPGFFPFGDPTVANVFFGVSFQTFCLERGVPLVPRPGTSDSIFGFAAYNIDYSLNDDGWAMHGGGGASGDPEHDAISLGTAYLYSQFVAGALAGYDYDPEANRVESAKQLQWAIWYLEDEMSYEEATVGGNTFLDLLGGIGGGGGTELQNIESWKTQDNNGFYNVAVLNLGLDRQDLLVAYPVSVPDGGMTLILMGIAMGGMWVVARRRKSAA